MKIKNLIGTLLYEDDSISLKETVCRANLRRANLCRADLYGADLYGASILIAGEDSRGYRFYAQRNNKNGEWEIKAGCRRFSPSNAVAHWENAHNDNVFIKTECLAKVNYLINMIKLYDEQFPLKSNNV